jgi:hypothetical protein
MKATFKRLDTPSEWDFCIKPRFGVLVEGYDEDDPFLPLRLCGNVMGVRTRRGGIRRTRLGKLLAPRFESGWLAPWRAGTLRVSRKAEKGGRWLRVGLSSSYSSRSEYERLTKPNTPRSKQQAFP